MQYPKATREDIKYLLFKSGRSEVEAPYFDIDQDEPDAIPESTPELPDSAFEPDDIEHFTDIINELAVFIVDSRVGLNDGWFKRWPLNDELTRWRANDGAIIEASLARFLGDYASEDFIDALTGNLTLHIPDIEEFIVRHN